MIKELSEEIKKRGYTIIEDRYNAWGELVYKLIIKKQGTYITTSYATSLEEALTNSLRKIKAWEKNYVNTSN